MTIRRGLVALALVVLAVVLVFGSGGRWDTYSLDRLATPGERQAAPAWTRNCLPGSLSPIFRACVRLQGRVVWVQHHDPDGDGDRHIVVLSRLRLRIVKIPRTVPIPRLPGRGATIEADGYTLDGQSGREEVDAQRLQVGRRVYIQGPLPP